MPCCSTTDCDRRIPGGFCYCREHAGSERGHWLYAEMHAGRADYLYNGLAQLDTRDGSKAARIVQRLRESYEAMCMGDLPTPEPMPDWDSPIEAVAYAATEAPR